MSKQEIDDSLYDIKEKIDMLINRECDGKEEVVEDGKGTKPKHTRSPYLFFCMEERQKLLKKHPDLKFGEISRDLSDEWNEMSETKKKRFIKLSE